MEEGKIEESGASITYVAAILGHKKPTTTLKYHVRWLLTPSIIGTERYSKYQLIWYSDTGHYSFYLPATYDG